MELVQGWYVYTDKGNWDLIYTNGGKNHESRAILYGTKEEAQATHLNKEVAWLDKTPYIFERRLELLDEVKLALRKYIRHCKRYPVKSGQEVSRINSFMQTLRELL